MMFTTAMSWFWFWPTLVVVGLLLLGYLAYRTIEGRDADRPDAHGGSARRILDERFARGEIDEEDYRRRSDLL